MLKILIGVWVAVLLYLVLSEIFSRCERCKRFFTLKGYDNNWDVCGNCGHKQR